MEPGLINARYCVSVALVHRKITLTAIADLANDKVMEIMGKTSVTSDDSLQAPEAGLILKLRNGEVLKSSHEDTYEDYCCDFTEEREQIQSPRCLSRE
ncbi:hypothetical protein ACFLXH_06030 [Chloroflexota bacterium]